MNLRKTHAKRATIIAPGHRDFTGTKLWDREGIGDAVRGERGLVNNIHRAMEGGDEATLLVTCIYKHSSHLRGAHGMESKHGKPKA